MNITILGAGNMARGIGTRTEVHLAGGELGLPDAHNAHGQRVKSGPLMSAPILSSPSVLANRATFESGDCQSDPNVAPAANASDRRPSS